MDMYNFLKSGLEKDLIISLLKKDSYCLFVDNFKLFGNLKGDILSVKPNHIFMPLYSLLLAYNTVNVNKYLKHVVILSRQHLTVQQLIEINISDDLSDLVIETFFENYNLY